MDIDLKSTHYTEALPIAPLTINPVTLTPVTVTPIAIHLKELNQVAPLSVESLRVDHVRHVDPLRIEQLNISSLPTVNLTMSQMPALDINVRRVPPVAVAIQQQFEMNSNYTMTARLFGLPLMRILLSGRTTITPKDCARREQSRSHERSFPDVAALGAPGIPSRAIETCVHTVRRSAPPSARRHGVNPG
ncbi:MAG TPA: hypothetical protein VNZ85_20740, partial [Caulobacter sp.]|nr:hypothetical protein [Caulobacter sp.]